MQKTSSLNLNLPELKDPQSPFPLNENFQVLDTASKAQPVIFLETDWTEVLSETDGTVDYATLTIPQTSHKRYGESFSYRIYHLVNDELVPSTWAALGTKVSQRASDGSITLTAAEGYSGTIVFYGT